MGAMSTPGHVRVKIPIDKLGSSFIRWTALPTVRRLVAFYVEQHNGVLPHSAFNGQTPDEMYFGMGDAVPEDLQSRAAAARRTRVEANRSTSCEICPLAVPAA
jgi:hypothetical protein